MKKTAVLLILTISAALLASCGDSGQTQSSSKASSSAVSSRAASSAAVISDIIAEESVAPTASGSVSQGPAVFPLKGYCAVGLVEKSEKKAKVVAQNGVPGELFFEDTAPKPGGVYYYEKSGAAYIFTEPKFINGSPVSSAQWEIAVYDNTHQGMPDIIYTNDGTNEFKYDFTPDSIIFARYSETEWRIFSGGDLIKSSGFPVMGWFEAVDSKDGGNKQVTVLVLGGYNFSESRIIGTDAGSTTFMDYEGYGWNFGDIKLSW